MFRETRSVLKAIEQSKDRNGDWYDVAEMSIASRESSYEDDVKTLSSIIRFRGYLFSQLQEEAMEYLFSASETELRAFIGEMTEEERLAELKECYEAYKCHLEEEQLLERQKLLDSLSDNPFDDDFGDEDDE